MDTHSQVVDQPWVASEVVQVDIPHDSVRRDERCLSIDGMLDLNLPFYPDLPLGRELDLAQGRCGEGQWSNEGKTRFLHLDQLFVFSVCCRDICGSNSR